MRVSREKPEVQLDPEFLVAISGGGIGGLALALALQRRGIRSIVFEQDPRFDARSQGYGLTMQQGGRALKELGILDSIRQRSQSSTSHFIFDSAGLPVVWWGAPRSLTQSESEWDAHRNCHIARQALRGALYEQLNPEFVTFKWNAQVREVAPDQSDALQVTVTDVSDATISTSYKVNCLIGADGIFSRVRSLLRVPTKLRYAGVFVMLGIVNRDAFPLLHGRVVQCSDGATRIFSMPFDSNRVMWQLSFPMPESEATALAASAKVSGTGVLLDEALRRCGSFSSPVVDLLNATPLDLITGYPVLDMNEIDAAMMQSGVDSDSPWLARLTLMGDVCTFMLFLFENLLKLKVISLQAAHAMTPFKGQGANQALLDGVILAEKLVAAAAVSPDTSVAERVAQALRAFEADMCQRSASKVRGSREAVLQSHCMDFIDTRAQLRRRGFEDQAAAELSATLLQRIERARAAGIGMRSEPSELDRVAFAET
jgi:2-polyprenyl-6-methoxyphenol hydroxylase-like FAD-dependent oxidoreductase